jgi:hypothetical protein
MFFEGSPPYVGVGMGGFTSLSGHRLLVGALHFEAAALVAWPATWTANCAGAGCPASRRAHPSTPSLHYRAPPHNLS